MHASKNTVYERPHIRTAEKDVKTRMIIVRYYWSLHYDTAKISKFCSNKDLVPAPLKSSVIYKLSCPGCVQ